MKLWEVIWGWTMWSGGVLTGWLLHKWITARRERAGRIGGGS